MSAFLKSPKFLKTLVFLGLLGLIVLIFSQKIDLTNSDLGRHLTNGRVVWSNPDILFHNAYSYTEPDFRFINHHWLYGVIVYSVYRVAGFAGLSLLNILIILGAFSLAFFTARQKTETGLTADSPRIDAFYFVSLLSLPVILLLSERVEIRPEIFSYFFIIATYALLEAADRTKRYRRLWLLMPLFALWANIHIYFFIGLALIVFKAAAIFIGAFLKEREGLVRSFLRRLFHRGRLLAAWQAARPWVIAGGAAALACPLNPNTWRGLIYPFNIFRNYGYEVAENKSVFFLEHLMVNNNYCLFKIILALLIISWVLYFIFYRPDQGRISLKERLSHIFQNRLFDLAVTFLLAGLALFASRNISLFGLAGLIIISANLAPVLILLRRKYEARAGLWQNYFLIFFLILIILSGAYLINDARRVNHFISNPLGFGLAQGNADSVAFFREKHLSGPIFNNYDIGSALIFWLYGQEPVFVDNRPEAYSNSFFNDIYKPIQTDAAKWEEHSKKFDFKTIYLAHTDGTPWARQFLRRILKDRKWRLIYFDAYTVILINSEKYSAAEVRELSSNQWAFKSRLRELTVGANLKTKFGLADLAQADGLPELAEEVYRQILFDFPDQPQALYSLANLYSGYEDRENSVKAINYFQRALAAGLRLPGVYNQLGLAYWDLGEYKKAEDAWFSALKQERKNTDALYYLNQIERLRKSGELPVD